MKYRGKKEVFDATVLDYEALGSTRTYVRTCLLRVG